MGKRESEYQITKDDYEADEDRIVEKSSGTSFARADPEVLAKRRIVRTAKRPASSNGSGGVAAGSSSGTGGAFANINLVPTNGNPMSSQSLSSKPRFAMPSLPEYNSQNNAPTTIAGKNPFGGVNLTTSNSIGNSVPKAQKSESAILTEKFREFIKKADLRKDYELPAIRYLTTMNNLRSSKGESATKVTVNTGAVSTNAAPSRTETTKSLFAPAPAPVAFSFGSTLQNSTSTPAASTPTFSFSTTGSSATGGVPASGLSSGFSFAPAPMTAAPTPGTNVKIALSPVPAPSLTITKSPTSTTNTTDGDGDDDALPPEEKTVLASADDDWDSLYTVKVRAYHYRTNISGTKFACGTLKVQQHKESQKRRMVLRDSAGKVFINIGISHGMEFNKAIPAAKPGSRPVGKITFKGVNDKDRGGETFALACPLENLEGFHKLLEESSS